LLVSMTFLRSPVLAIFAIMLTLPGTNVSARALDVFDELRPLRTRRIESSGTSRKDYPGLATAGIGGEELRLRLSDDFTRRVPQRIGVDTGWPISGGAVEDVEGVAGLSAVGNCTLSEPPAGTASPGLRRVGGGAEAFWPSPAAC